MWTWTLSRWSGIKFVCSVLLLFWCWTVQTLPFLLPNKWIIFSSFNINLYFPLNWILPKHLQTIAYNGDGNRIRNYTTHIIHLWMPMWNFVLHYSSYKFWEKYLTCHCLYIKTTGFLSVCVNFSKLLPTKIPSQTSRQSCEMKSACSGLREKNKS